MILHQIFYFIMAVVQNFLEPLAYREILQSGIGARSYSRSICIATGMISWKLYEYHIKLNYFSGSMLVMQHLRAALLRKYAEGTAAALCTAALCTAAALGSAAALCTA